MKKFRMSVAIAMILGGIIFLSSLLFFRSATNVPYARRVAAAAIVAVIGVKLSLLLSKKGLGSIPVLMTAIGANAFGASLSFFAAYDFPHAAIMFLLSYVGIMWARKSGKDYARDHMLPQKEIFYSLSVGYVITLLFIFLVAFLLRPDLHLIPLSLLHTASPYAF